MATGCSGSECEACSEHGEMRVRVRGLEKRVAKMEEIGEKLTEIQITMAKMHGQASLWARLGYALIGGVITFAVTFGAMRMAGG